MNHASNSGKIPIPARESFSDLTYEERLQALSIATSEQNLENARLTHKKITEQISMRTTTIASIAGTIFAEILSSGNATLAEKFGNATDIVRVATEIVEAAEAADSKAKELQAAKDANVV